MRQHYIYRLTDPVTEKYYIGARTAKDCLALEDNDYMGSYGQDAFTSEEEDRLEKEVIAIFPTRELAFQVEEQVILKVWDSDDLCVNKYPIHWKFFMATREGEGHYRYGQTLTEEHKRNISIALSGENNAWYGVTGKDHPRYGATLTKEHRKAISEANTGRIMSEETRKAIGEARKGKTRDFTKEWIDNLSESLEGRTLSEEHKNNLKKARANIPPYPHKRKCMHIPSGKTYDTLTSAAEAHGVSKTTVVDHCKDKLIKKDFKYIE